MFHTRSRITAYEKTEKYEKAFTKTYYFFLPIENKRLTKNVSLIGNDVETSELLHSGMFCTNQKNAFLMCKDSIFF